MYSQQNQIDSDDEEDGIRGASLHHVINPATFTQEEKTFEDNQCSQQPSLYVTHPGETISNPEVMTGNDDEPSSYPRMTTSTQNTTSSKSPSSKPLSTHVASIDSRDWWAILFFHRHPWTKLSANYQAELSFLSIIFSLISSMTYPVVFSEFSELNDTPVIRDVFVVTINLAFMFAIAALCLVIHSYFILNISMSAEAVMEYFTNTFKEPFQMFSLSKLIGFMTRCSMLCCTLSCVLYAIAGRGRVAAVIITAAFLAFAVLIGIVVFGWEFTFTGKMRNIASTYTGDGDTVYSSGSTSSTPSEIHPGRTSALKESQEKHRLYEIMCEAEAEAYFGTITQHCPSVKHLKQLFNKRDLLDLCNFLDAPFYIISQLDEALKKVP